MADHQMWDERYSTFKHYYGTEPNDFLREQVGRIRPHGTVLCIADGEGRNSVWLAKQGFDVTSMDFSPVALRHAQSLAIEEGVNLRTVQGDLEVWDFGVGTWDAIVSIWVHMPPSYRGDAHQRCVQALRPGGCFILEAYRPEQISYGTGGPPEASMMMTSNTLATELAGLDLIVNQELDRSINEGVGHVGMSAVVQVIGVRPA